jgi:molybdate transport system regulatory protein
MNRPADQPHGIRQSEQMTDETEAPPPEAWMRHAAVLSIRLRFGDDARIGPGKIALLEAIARTGSIAAAGREMGMSYRRAWLLIDSLNRMFDEPVVHASSGGAHGGGAGLSALGGQLVAAYRAMEQETEHAVARHFAALRSRMVTSASDDQRTRDA